LAAAAAPTDLEADVEPVTTGLTLPAPASTDVMMGDTVVVAPTTEVEAEPELGVINLASSTPASTELVVHGTVDVMGALVCPAEAYELTGGDTATAVVLYHG
jgi:hypothetical protein